MAKSGDSAVRRESEKSPLLGTKTTLGGAGTKIDPASVFGKKPEPPKKTFMASAGAKIDPASVFGKKEEPKQRPPIRNTIG